MMSEMKIGLSLKGGRLFKFFRVPRAIKKIEMDAQLDQAIVRELVQLEILSEQGDTAQPADFHSNFQDWKSQRGMLLDRRRTQAFQDAIKTVIHEGDNVIDVGAGSGILSMFASRAGAGQVYSLEITDIVNTASRIACANDIHAIDFIQGDAGNFKADALVDVVLGEFAGMYLVDEWRHFAAFVKVRDANLKPGGEVIPRAATMYLSAVDNHRLYVESGFGFWESPVYGLDFSSVFDIEVAHPRREIMYQLEEKSIVDTVTVASFDFRTANSSDYLFEKELEFVYPAAGSCHGFIGYFDLEMTPGKYLSTAPLESSTNWRQSYFPMPAVQLRAGEKLRIALRIFLNPESDELCIGLRHINNNPISKAPELVYVLDQTS
jgi:2-polyprenyl-3-methyl-5-hydroxy-6-metoxy-1,4-benzoquinol methylase